jgi:hypothetical protein
MRQCPTLHPRQQRRLRTVPAAPAKLRAAGPALGDAAVLAVPDIGHTHVCSMFARMSRYGPVAGGTTRQPGLPVCRTARHVIA